MSAAQKFASFCNQATSAAWTTSRICSRGPSPSLWKTVCLDAELDDELGYSKYDYRNKDTDNSRNGHSSKTLQYPVPKATDTGAPIEAVDCQIRRKVMW